MFFSNLSAAFFAVAAFVSSVQGQTCRGDASGIDEPNWNIQYAWYLRESMYMQGGCSSTGARSMADPECRKSLIPDLSYSVMLKGNVTDQTDSQHSQDCYDKVVRLASTEV